MREAFDVLDAWGFEQKTILTWAKDMIGMGDWLRGQTEHCILATRGKPIVTLTNKTTLLHAPYADIRRSPSSSTTLQGAAGRLVGDLAGHLEGRVIRSASYDTRIDGPP